MTAEALRMEPNCKACGRPLTLIEMHLNDELDGTARCDECDVVMCFEAGVLPLGFEPDEEESES